MTDREKVIRAIDGRINIGDYCNDCDYDGCVFHHGSCEKDLLADALALLKEQDAKTGHWIPGCSMRQQWVKCDICGTTQTHCWPYCPNCGAAMLREELKLFD